jgi:hypothetical protein
MEENVEARTYKGWMAEITAMGANASWILGHWETMSEFLEGDKVSNTYDIELTRSASFYKAILAIQNQRFKMVQQMLCRFLTYSLTCHFNVSMLIALLHSSFLCIRFRKYGRHPRLPCTLKEERI